MTLKEVESIKDILTWKIGSMITTSYDDLVEVCTGSTKSIITSLVLNLSEGSLVDEIKKMLPNFCYIHSTLFFNRGVYTGEYRTTDMEGEHIPYIYIPEISKELGKVLLYIMDNPLPPEKLQRALIEWYKLFNILRPFNQYNETVAFVIIAALYNYMNANLLVLDTWGIAHWSKSF